MGKTGTKWAGWCLGIFVAGGVVACASPTAGDDTDESESVASTEAAARSVPQVVVAPNPVQAGSIAITKPVARGSGLRPGRQYYVRLNGGYDVSAMASIAAWVTTDSQGRFAWTLRDDPSYGIPDELLEGSGTLEVAESRQNGAPVIVASLALAVTPSPGAATASPASAAPGTTLTVAGSGAAAGASLEIEWYDGTSCSCWMAGCHSCTYTARRETVTAGADGTFTKAITPSAANNGYCRHPVSVRDVSSGVIVASTTFSICT